MHANLNVVEYPTIALNFPKTGQAMNQIVHLSHHLASATPTPGIPPSPLLYSEELTAFISAPSGYADLCWLLSTASVCTVRISLTSRRSQHLRPASFFLIQITRPDLTFSSRRRDTEWLAKPRLSGVKSTICKFYKKNHRYVIIECYIFWMQKTWMV